MSLDPYRTVAEPSSDEEREIIEEEARKAAREQTKKQSAIRDYARSEFYNLQFDVDRIFGVMSYVNQWSHENAEISFFIGNKYFRIKLEVPDCDLWWRPIKRERWKQRMFRRIYQELTAENQCTDRWSVFRIQCHSRGMNAKCCTMEFEPWKELESRPWL